MTPDERKMLDELPMRTDYEWRAFFDDRSSRGLPFTKVTDWVKEIQRDALKSAIEICEMCAKRENRIVEDDLDVVAKSIKALNP